MTGPEVLIVLATLSLRHRSGRVLAAACSIGCTIVGAVVLWVLPRVTFPEPTGPAQVGTTRFEWVDESRDEQATRSHGDRRTVVVQVWYPAAPRPDDHRALYLGRTAEEARRTADGIAATYGVPSLLLHEAVVARAPAHLDAPPLQSGPRWPVVVFSPGLAGYRAQNTSWAEELASHGYLVVAVDHLYDSAAVVLTSFVVTQIEAMERGQIRSPFGGRIETGSVAAAGHSVGGAAAILAAQNDRRIDAVIDLDGSPRSVPPRRFSQPMLALVAGRGTGDAQNDETYRRTLSTVLRNSDGGGFCLTVDGASHLTFTDAPMILPPLPSLIGSGGRRRGHDVTSQATLVFLDAVLRNHHSDISGPLGERGKVDDECSG